MSEPHLYLEIPKPSAEDYRRHKEWAEKQQQEENKDRSDKKVIVIDI